MKKALAFLLAAVMLCLSAGCSGSKQAAAPASQASGQASQAEAKTGSGGKKVGVCMPEKNLQRWVQDGDNMKKVLESKGYTVELQYANNDVNTQVSQIENMITSGVNVLVIASIDGSALSDALKQAKTNNVKVIAYDRLLMNSENVDYYATFDNTKVGTLQGQYIVDKLGVKEGKGPFNIEIFSGAPDDNNAKYVYKGAMDVLKPYIDSKKLVVKSGQTDFAKCATEHWKTEVAQARMDNLLSANYASGAKLDAVLTPNDAIARGVLSSLKNIGYGSSDKPFPITTGQDCEKSNVTSIAKGEQSMSIFKDTRTLANKVAGMVDALLQGKEAEVNDTKTYDNGVKVVPTYLCDPIAVTKDNYEKTLIDSGYYTKADLGL
ncbi:MAG TPA: ABC transporter substrate-binding protein [Ruminococcaceae bacterium]|jgi:putative multiple sugar transport system substrate-binding protein|nr:ABC transporter substrate-binding protein [Oscillospiraceae bacterium]HBG54768.1 ABC transporter substrate-binding protein [Oscillospiraceae bacterium]HBQ47007.1 ABC transporter substrate-binding protein [Oscillospiraceae bacterium]HBT90381.1 ABC transporter substrate-binding protein [Oscillospiraceae bacterium]HCB91011.1 ABC transporter substrate-binding protein [Oscillospiraceae bacterium]